MSTPNIPMLRKAVEWVEAEAELPWHEREWNQSTWFSPHRRPRDITTLEDYTISNCGTSCCVAGYIAIQEGWTPTANPEGWTKNGVRRKPWKIAQSILGLEFVEAMSLFYSTNTPAEIRIFAEEIAGERL